MATLYPGGDVTQAPADLVDAVSAALQVLSFSELPEDEVPPRNIWHHNERLDEWWKSVKQKRDEKYSGGKERQAVPQADEGSMQGNELAERFRQ